MGFKEWTVLKHKAIERTAANLWTVEGYMPRGNQRRMTVARLRDGRLVVHNAIALDEAEMRELDEFGRVAAIVVPNGFHRQDAGIWKARYPAAKVYAPRKVLAKVGKVVAVDGDLDAVPRDDSVQTTHIDGMAYGEGVIEVQSDSGTSLIFNDAVLNVEPMKGMAGFIMGPTGLPSVPRFARWVMIKNRRAFAAHLQRLATSDVRRVFPGHGDTIETDAADILSGLARGLGADAPGRAL